MFKKVHIIISLTTVLVILMSCTEPYALITNGNENILVVEATITNENKKQIIKLSRTFNPQESQSSFEGNATVYLKDNLGAIYPFEEVNEVYESVVAFQAQPNLNYQLFITTTDGEQFQSTVQKLSDSNPIDNLTAIATTSYGTRGVSITTNKIDPQNKLKYYRYEYEETYKIIVPYPSQDSATVVGTSCVFFPPELIPYQIFDSARTEESETCFKTDISGDIILNSTANQTNGNVSNFEVRFISQENTIIANRYSILVREYIHSEAAYNYYNVLKKLNDTNGVLSPVQPGYIKGNIINATNRSKKVIGFFDVTSVSEKRIFFNYEDIFPNEPQPPYFVKCFITDHDINSACEELKGIKNLVSFLRNNIAVIYRTERPIYKLVPAKCGDCRYLGSNKVPSFWVD